MIVRTYCPDWSWIRSLPRDHRRFPDAKFVVPFVAIEEIADASRVENGLAEVIRQFVAENNVTIGMDPLSCAEQEQGLHTSRELRHVINVKASIRLTNLARTPVHWRKYFDVLGEIGIVRRNEFALAAIRRRFSQVLSDPILFAAKSELRGFGPACSDYGETIRRVSVRYYVRQTRWQRPPIRQRGDTRHDRHPDRSAFGRYVRTQVWCSLRNLSHHESAKTRNDYTDSHYSWLASYCGRLLTKDSGLSKMTTDCFPWVRVDSHL